MEVKAAIGLHQLLLQLRCSVHRPAVEGQHVRKTQNIHAWIETIKIGQEKPRGVANSAIGVGGALEYFITDRQFTTVVGCCDPQAQNISAKLIHRLLGWDNIAKRLGHLAAVTVHRKAVSQHCLVRRCTVDSNAGQQRRLKPPPMLVGAFQIEIRRTVQFIALT